MGETNQRSAGGESGSGRSAMDRQTLLQQAGGNCTADNRRRSRYSIIGIDNDLSECIVGDHRYSYVSVAKNDGLHPADWLDWFSCYDLSKPMAIINFTQFRY